MSDDHHVYRRASPLRRTSAFALDLALFFLLFAVGWILLAWVLASRGQTPGKALTRRFVTRTDGTPALPGLHAEPMGSKGFQVSGAMPLL